MKRNELAYFYTHLRPGLTVYLTRLMGLSRDNTEEVIQQTAIALWEMEGSLSGIRNLKAWCYTIARNKAVDLIRKAGRTLSEIPEDYPDNGSGVETALLTGEQRSCIREFLSGLPERDREIAFLVYYENLTTGEAAAALDCPSGTVKYRLHEIRKKLTGHLKKGGWI